MSVTERDDVFTLTRSYLTPQSRHITNRQTISFAFFLHIATHTERSREFPENIARIIYVVDDRVLHEKEGTEICSRILRDVLKDIMFSKTSCPETQNTSVPVRQQTCSCLSLNNI